ncbi:hypothetical protein [Actinoplanes sp. NPDC020271]|uniref:hypothetical protein n=1 Tax=Actinoplanes sp. NPDC020271 TaxID=3363896 RepID=UPI0037994CB2
MIVVEDGGLVERVVAGRHEFRRRAARVTARRYREHLAESGRAVRTPRYGGPGRPEVEYRPA